MEDAMLPSPERVIVGGLVFALGAVSATLAISEFFYRRYRWSVHGDPLPPTNGASSTTGRGHVRVIPK
jgi:hypothetical protein